MRQKQFGGKILEVVTVTDSILVDVSKKREILGLEILDASRNIGKIKPEKVEVSFAQP